MPMKPVLTDQDLLMEFITTQHLNETQIKYLINNRYIEADDYSLTIKGIETAYGKIDDYQKGTGKLF